MTNHLFAGMWLLCPLAAGAATAASLMPVDLRCEYLPNPLGIDATAPRLSWKLETTDASARGLVQSAYQVLVASSAEKLAKSEGDLWDSGKVASDASIHIVYAGVPLQPRMQCFWRVRVWGMTLDAGNSKLEEAACSGWSQSASWSMGLLKQEDWSAKWIVAGDTRRAPVKLKILRAEYGTGASNESMDVTDKLAAMVTPTGISVAVENGTFDRDPIPDKVKRLHVEYDLNGVNKVNDVPEHQTFAVPEPTVAYLRKSFAASKPLRNATVYATALGLYELSINGQRVGDYVLAPEWTDYNKRMRYQAYDVTALLKKGSNALGALLANGWYSGHIGNGGFQYWGTTPAMLVQLEITYADGTTERIITDKSWRIADSPLLATDFMLGESYDARNEIPGWDMPGLDDAAWATATERRESRRLDAQVMEPVRVVEEIKTKAITEPAPGKWTFDLGQNMVGVVRLKVNAPAGTTVTIRHAEVLNADGTLYTTNLRGAPSIDHYTCKGGGTETWQPTFTFHGFRYVELSGLPSKPALDAVTGIVIASDTPPAGQFSCSDPRLNQLQSNIQWGQRGNYLSVPTDCPQRDERLGWMGDAHVFVRTATYNADVAAFFTKWLVDVDDAQHADGAFTDVAPKVGSSAGTPAWADAGVICPWAMYLVYHDTRLLEQHYPAMVKWVDWCQAHSTDLVRNKDRGADYGDWLSINANTPRDVIGTAFFAHSAALVAKAAKVLGRAGDAAKYTKLAADVKAAFNKKYVAPDGRIHGNTQTVYVMALMFGLLPEPLQPLAAQHLEDDVKARGWHLSTGFVGAGYLLHALSDAGKLDTAYRLMLQDTFPSWLFPVKHGATTIWERWDGWTPEKGFQDPGMNSFNHYAYGSCGDWMFGTMAGIDTDGPGYKKIIIRPQPGGGITNVTAHYDSIHGRIESAWRIEDGTIRMSVTIPPNTTATIHVPTADPAGVKEGGKPVGKAAGINVLRSEADGAVLAAGSGQYRFEASAPRKGTSANDHGTR